MTVHQELEFFPDSVDNMQWNQQEWFISSCYDQVLKYES